MHQVSVIVSQHLNFNVLRPFQVFLYENVVNTEGFFGFAFGAAELRNQFFRSPYNPHSSSAAACSRFEHNRISAEFRVFYRLFLSPDRFFHAWNRRNAYFIGHDLGLDLVPQMFHHLICRSDEYDSRFFTGSGKSHIFRKESISRMNRVYAFRFCQLDDFINRQISVYR